MNLSEKIIQMFLLGASVHFNKNINTLEIKVIHNNKIELVCLPYSHLNEHSIVKYIDFMFEKLNKKP